MPGVIIATEITNPEQFDDPQTAAWAKDKIKETAAQLAVNEIVVTDIWGPNTVVFRDPFPAGGSGYNKARLKAAELAGIRGITEDNSVRLVIQDAENPPQVIGAFRMRP